MSFKNKVSNNQILAISIGVVYLWFGSLKFFHGQSPAEDLAKNTISALSFNLIPPNISIILLAILESLVGSLLIINRYRKTTILVVLVHLILTFSPMLLFTEQVFTKVPFQFTLLGQYIFKNIIIVAAALILYKESIMKK